MTPRQKTTKRRGTKANRRVDLPKTIIIANPVDAAMRRFVEACNANNEAGEGFSREDARLLGREAYEAIAATCHAYIQPENFPAHLVREPFPPVIARAVWSLVTNALAGRRTLSFEDLFSAHAPNFSASEKKEIYIAVAYVQAAQEKIVHDPKFIKNVANWYGVHRRTILNWVREFGIHDLLANFYPNLSEEDRAERITNLAKTRGAFYARYGRGQGATNARNKKRS